jgi:hypothetical protein
MPGRRKPSSLKLCAVAWCAAFATDGDHCPVHAKHPSLHPQYLAADETFAPDLAPCDECDGSGECDTCSGTGECGTWLGHDCTTCGAVIHGHDCGHCEGTGKCHHCHGEGRVTFTKKAASA